MTTASIMISSKLPGEPYDDITVMETFHALTKDAGNVTHLKRGDNIALWPVI